MTPKEIARRIQVQIDQSWSEVSPEGLGGAEVRCIFCGNEVTDWMYAKRDFKHKPTCAVVLIKQLVDMAR